MKVSSLFAEAGVEPSAMFGDAEALDLTADSRQIVPGSILVLMPSANTDTNAFIADAVSAGAVAIVAHDREGLEIAKNLAPCAVLLDSGTKIEDALWRLGKVFFGNPTGSMQLIGVTGTNGKTTTAWLLRDMAASTKVRAGYLGTLGFQMRGETRDVANTTPFPIELNRLLAGAREEGIWTLAMEVSSHALAQKRADGLEFDVAIFTNLTQDHLDFHGSMAAYEAAKKRLFFELPKLSGKTFVPAFNVEDPVGERWASEYSGEKISFGLTTGDLRGAAASVGLDEIILDLSFRGETERVQIPLGGLFNVQNAVAAAAGFLALGKTLSQTAEALAHTTPAPGRFEAVPNESEIGVIVDYAHTPDALVKLLESARPLVKGRMITVFGCGGDRDRAKRPLMATAASSRSDLTVITSDNPRTEKPESILDDVEKGVESGKEFRRITDREEAVAFAIREAKPGDAVIIAGKGHENYQIIGREKRPMDDRELARKALAALV